MNRFTPEQLTDGENLLKAFAAVHVFSDASHERHAKGFNYETGVGETRLEITEETPGQFSLSLLTTPRPVLAVEAFGETASLNSLAIAANENLQEYIRRYTGRMAHFFPKKDDGSIAVESLQVETGIAYKKHVAGEIIEQNPFSATALTLKVRHFAGRSTTEKVYMGGGYVRYVGACTVGRLAIV